MAVFSLVSPYFLFGMVVLFYFHGWSESDFSYVYLSHILVFHYFCNGVICLFRGVCGQFHMDSFGS